MSAEDENKPQNESKAQDGMFVWIAKHGPKWARVPAILMGMLVAVVPALLLLNNAMEKWVFHSADSAASGQLQEQMQPDVVQPCMAF